jgi:hypothetical protein
VLSLSERVIDKKSGKEKEKAIGETLITIREL